MVYEHASPGRGSSRFIAVNRGPSRFRHMQLITSDTTRHQDTISPRKDAFRPSPLLKSFNPASQIANQKFGDPQLSTLNQLSVHPGTAWDTLVTPSVTPWKCKIP